MATRQQEIERITREAQALAGKVNTVADAEKKGLKVNPNTTVADAQSFTATSKLPPLPDAKQGIDRVTNLSAAMNTAIGMARNQRQDQTLDLVGGLVPEGALPASSFASVLDSFNRSSAPIENTLLSGAVNNAADQEERAFKMQLDERDRIIENQSSIRNLATTVAENGGDAATINSVLSFADTGDVDAAIKAAAAYLNTKSKNEVRQVGSNLVSIDDDGNVNVLYSAPSGGGGGTGTFSSGGLRASNSELGGLSSELEGSRGADGYSNTQLYADAYNEWTRQGGLPKDFFSRFDPDIYLNPDDPTIPPVVRGQMRSSSDQDLFNNIPT